MVGGTVGRSVRGEILTRRERPRIKTAEVTSLEILRYPGELSEFSDVTRVVETPTALKTHSLCAYKTC